MSAGMTLRTFAWASCAWLLVSCGGASTTPEAPSPPATGAPDMNSPTAHFGPPLARAENTADTLHGQQVSDPYRWLEVEKAPEVKAWMKEYDRFTRGHLSELPGRAALTARVNELSYIDFVGAPQRRGGYVFFTRRHKDKEKAIYYVRQGKTGEPKVLLDPNTMSEDGSVAVKGIFPSYDGKTVIYKLSKNNADEATLHIMDVATQKTREAEEIVGAKYAYPSWSPDHQGFYYVRLPTDSSIPVSELPGYAELRYHKLGTSPDTDALIYEKSGDPQRFLHGEVSRDGRWLLAYHNHGWNRTDVYFRDLKAANLPSGKEGFKPLVVGEDAKFGVMPWQGKFYIHTDYGAPRGRVLVADPKEPKLAAFKELIGQQEDAVLEEVDIVGGRLALSYLRRASTELRLHELSGKLVRPIALPSLGSATNLMGNPEDDEAYYTFSSFTTPFTTYEVSVKSGVSKPYFTLDVPVDASPYEVKQVHYPSKDGTQISMFIVHKRGITLDGSTPFLLHGYGGFSINETPEFDAANFAWLERGAGYALPNLRGGGEYGEEWHRDGMLLKKQNVFDDFIAAAEYLTKEGYTRPERLAISGGSNGGLLVGAAMTQRPELFKAVVCAVPLLDMVRYHLFGSGKTWIAEYGSAEDPEQFRALHAYSPYHHVKQGVSYPALLMLSADSDDRVDPMHARKFTAAIQAAQGSPTTPVLFRMEANAGHGGGDLVEKTVARKVDTFAFLFSQLGVRLD